MSAEHVTSQATLQITPGVIGLIKVAPLSQSGFMTTFAPVTMGRIYPGAPRGFRADCRARYRKDAADGVWDRMQSRFQQYNVLG